MLSSLNKYGWHIGSEKPFWPRLCYNRSQKIFTAVRTLFTAVRTLFTAVKTVSTAVKLQSQWKWFWLQSKMNLIAVKIKPITGKLTKWENPVPIAVERKFWSRLKEVSTTIGLDANRDCKSFHRSQNFAPTAVNVTSWLRLKEVSIAIKMWLWPRLEKILTAMKNLAIAVSI